MSLNRNEIGMLLSDVGVPNVVGMYLPTEDGKLDYIDIVAITHSKIYVVTVKGSTPLTSRLQLVESKPTNLLKRNYLHVLNLRVALAGEGSGWTILSKVLVSNEESVAGAHPSYCNSVELLDILSRDDLTKVHSEEAVTQMQSVLENMKAENAILNALTISTKCKKYAW